MIGVILTLIQDEARRIWCYRWLALLTSAVLFIASAAYILHLPSAYEAWGQLYVSKQTPLAAAANGVSLLGDSNSGADMVQKTLLNDETLEVLLLKTDPEAARLDRTARAAAVARLRSRIRVTPDTGDGFLEFHVIDSDPARASRTASLLLQQFIARNVSRSRAELLRAESFLNDQIAAHEGQLAAAQARLSALQRRAAPARGAVFQVAAAPAPAPTPGAPKVYPGAERVAALETRLATLRGLYTEDYPDVVSTRRQLSEARTALAAERASEGASAGAAPALAAPRPTPTRVRTLRPHAIELPAAPTAERADAERTAEVLRLNYQQLIAKREAAGIALAVYGGDGAGRFQITRQPRIPTTPTGPKRGLFLALAGLMALLGGVAAAYLRGAIRGILVSPRELELVCQLPVVGTVSWEPAWATRPRKTRRPGRRIRTAAVRP